MQAKEYYQKALETAIYQHKEYPLLGIMGEFGEIAEKIKKIIRDDDYNLTERKRELILKEIGDLMWYINGVCHEYDIEWVKIYEDIVDRPYIEMSIENSHSIMITLGICVLNLCALAIQDDPLANCVLITKDVNLNIRALLTNMKVLCGIFNTSLEEIMDLNIKKLQDRQSNNKIAGDGDER